MDLTKNISECSHALNAKTGILCTDAHVISKLSDVFNVDKKGPVDQHKTMELIKNVVGCDSESCVLTKPEVHEIIGADVAQKQLVEKFKPVGPHNTNDWFSNFNIDNVLEQVAVKHPDFLHVEFQMRDFETAPSQHMSLSKIDFVEQYATGIRRFGVVFNTDKSTGNGQHWFAIYGDFSKSKFTLEYFNSAGDQPLDEICSWLTDTKHRLIKGLNKPPKDVEVITVTDIVNQKDNHSCGSYSLYYIMSRLDGAPWEYFKKNKIGDAKMHDFRKNHLFRKTA